MAKNDQFAQANVNRHWGNQLAKHGQVTVVFGIIPFNFTSVRVFRTNWNVQYLKINGFITTGKKYVLLVGSNAPMSLRWRIVLKKERKTILKPIMMEKENEGTFWYFLGLEDPTPTLTVLLEAPSLKFWCLKWFYPKELVASQLDLKGRVKLI